MIIIKKTILVLACCALVAPLAFSKDTKKIQTRPWHLGFVERGVTVTAPGTVNRIECGEVTGYQPAGTVVIRQDGAGYFVLEDATRILNRRGEMVRGAIRAGTRVQVYFASIDGSPAIDHVVVY
jgi:hypothetical protein